MDKQTLISKLLRVDNLRYLTNWWRKYEPDIKLLPVEDRKKIRNIKRDLKEKILAKGREKYREESNYPF